MYLSQASAGGVRPGPDGVSRAAGPPIQSLRRLKEKDDQVCAWPSAFLLALTSPSPCETVVQDMEVASQGPPAGRTL
jgi:hypothetical protein